MATPSGANYLFRSSQLDSASMCLDVACFILARLLSFARRENGCLFALPHVCCASKWKSWSLHSHHALYKRWHSVHIDSKDGIDLTIGWLTAFQACHASQSTLFPLWDNGHLSRIASCKLCQGSCIAGLVLVDE